MSTIDNSEMSNNNGGATTASTNAAASPPTAGEEGIMVAIRMRPLNSRESSSPNEDGGNNKSSNHRVWRVLQKYNSVAQCTTSGKPLPERIVNRNFFTYDKTFGESSTTRQVYDNVAKGIVQSVSDGLNGTIFAYGQTSSGKTFTMQGEGTLQDGATAASSSNNNSGGGIVHMAAADIFTNIEADPTRVFLVRVSFIEIYNEEVRDLLVPNNSDEAPPLVVREDKRRGVFVNANETIVTSVDGLLGVLFAGEKNRHVGSTAMNERSSRSHTIFRITVESRLNNSKDDDDGDEESDDEEDLNVDKATTATTSGNGAVRVSTLNLVDLAGSESVRHTGATGDRQKEGVKINLSLLTLSRVISNLGQGAAHINFRDSKLTRILQPSLSGNARMAVICCATPSDLYLEETRSTLQFASRAKLVKTRAQVNEVMDDRSLIKKLQRELREARRGGPGKETMEQMKALEEKAASAEDANRKAEQDLKRMKELLLKGGVLKSTGTVGNFVYNGDDEMISHPSSANDDYSLKSSKKGGTSKRRYSDGIINDNENGDPQLTSPLRGGTISQKNYARTEMKAKKMKTGLSAKDKSEDSDVMLLREALAAKSSQAVELKMKLQQVQQEVLATQKKLEYECGEKEMIRMAKHDLESQVSTLTSDKDFALQEQDIMIAEKDAVIASSMEKIESLTIEQKEQAKALSNLEGQVTSLQDQLAAKETELADQVRKMGDEMSTEKEEFNSKISELEETLETVNSEKSQLTNEVESLNQSLSMAKTETESLQAEFDEKMKTMNSTLEGTVEGHEQKVAELSAEVTKLTEERDNLQSTLEEKKSAIVELEEAAQASMSDLDTKNSTIESLENTKTDLEEQVGTLQTSMEGLTASLDEKVTALGEAESTIATLREEAESSTTKIDELKTTIDEMQKLMDSKSETAAKVVELQEQVDKLLANGAKLMEEKTSLEVTVSGLEESLSNESEAKAALQADVQEKESAINDAQTQLNEANTTIEGLNEEKAGFEAKISSLEEEVSSLKDTVTSLGDSLEAEQLNVKELTSQLEESKNDVIKLTEENDASSQSNQDLQASLTEVSGLKEKLEASVADLETKLESVTDERNTAQSRVSELVSGNGDMEKIMQAVQTEKDELASKLEETNENLKAAEAMKQELMGKVETEIAEKESIREEMSTMEAEHSTKLSELETNISEMVKVKEELGASILDLEAKLESVSKERDVAQSRVSELASGHGDMEQIMQTMQFEKDDVSSKLEEANEKLTAVEAANKELMGKIEAANAEKDVISTEMSKLESEHSSKLSELSEEVEQLNDKITALTSELDTCKSNRDDAASQLEEITVERDTLQSRVDELLSGSNSSQETLSTLEADKETLSSQLSDVSSQLEAKDNEISGLKTSIESAIAEKETLSASIVDAESKYNEKINELNSSIEEKDVRISQLSEQIEALQDTTAQSTNNANEEEIQELKSLLASANDSVNEARSSAAMADQELERKELELEDALRRLEEEGEARRIAEDKVELAKQSPRNSAKCDSEEELLKEMEVLMGEKIDAESRLESELKKRKEFEEGVKRSAEEEKQMLVEEAEEKMVSLRDKISQLQSDLSRAESECYTMKDEMADLRDRYETAEVKAADTNSVITSMTDELRVEREQKAALESQISQLQEQSESFKSQVFEAKQSFEAQAHAKISQLEGDLSEAMSRLARSQEELKQSNERIAYMTSHMEEGKNELTSTKSLAMEAVGEKEMEISRLREQLATAKLTLQTSEAQVLSAKRELEDAKEKVEMIRTREHAKRQELASKAEATVNALKTRLETATAANARLDMNGGSEDSNREVEELKMKIREKDARIVKLEKAKITRAQIEQITKLKDERSQFKAEAENYKQRLADLENDESIGRSTRRGLRERNESDHDQSQQIAKLQDDLKQCEDKLRKYVHHSERLECDRKGAMDAVASYNIGDVVGGSLVETVASICERLASLEEECNALSQSETKAMQYLAELDSLRVRFDKLQSDLQGCQEEKEKLTSQLEESEDNLSRCQGKIVELTKDRNSLQSLAESAKHSVSELQSEKRRQMQFLENENLQIGDELKRAKEELQRTKAALDAAQKQSIGGEDTQELVGFSSLQPSQVKSDRKPPLQPSKSNFGTPSKSAKKRAGYENVYDEENTQNYTPSKKLKSSTSKTPSKKLKNAFASLTKSSKKNTSVKKKISDDSPTKFFQLNDGGEQTQDLTSECKQS